MTERSQAKNGSRSEPPDSSRSVAEMVERLGPWFHNLHLPDGTQTAPNHFLGQDFPRFKWERIAPALPADLSGWSALDVGCNAGFYSFELARRGAKVWAIDHDPHYLRQARWAAGQLGLEERVCFSQQQLYTLAREAQQFDLVWFMGVIYHLRYPFLGLEIVARRTRRLMVFQAMTMPDAPPVTPEPDYAIDQRQVLAAPGWPRLAFVEHSFAGDPTNWWVPNAACCEAMLRAAGMRIVRRIDEETYVCEPHPARRLDEGEYLAAIGNT